ncbi:MAG: plasmid replication protein, CyRepA1 family, partial [Microcystaceae cyanobacterium]
VYTESLIPDLEIFAAGGRRFYFCFDRDTKPKTLKNVNLAILKTGKLLEQKGCDVQVITFPGPEKGVDEFIAAQGAIAFAQVYAKALPLASWQWHIRKQAELTYIPWLLLDTPELNQVQLPIAQSHSDELEVDERSPYLLKLDENQTQQLPNGGIIVLASGKGTGKTKLISRLVSGFDKVIAAGHRIALMRNLCTRMGLDYKGDVDKVNGDFVTGSAYTLRLGLCVDSLLSINPEKFAGCILVIDEFMQVFTHLLTSSTCNKDGKRAALLARLHWLIRVASWVIVADADAADAGIDYIKALRGEESSVYLIRNDYQPQGYPVRFIEATGDDAIVAELLRDVRAGLRVFIATDAKRGSQALKKLVETLNGVSEPVSQAKLVLINSDTSGGEYEVDFIRNINERVTETDIVIATPS